MKKIVFATNNQHKLDEIRQILGSAFEVLSLNDIGCHEEIPEDHDTLQENALQKAKYIADHYEVDCFADDTGLEVEALNGEPGVHSARYAEGTDHDSEANMDKLLRKLGNNNNRRVNHKESGRKTLRRHRRRTHRLREEGYGRFRLRSYLRSRWLRRVVCTIGARHQKWNLTSCPGRSEARQIFDKVTR